MLQAERDFPTILYAITHGARSRLSKIRFHGLNEIIQLPVGSRGGFENIVIVYESHLAFSIAVLYARLKSRYYGLLFSFDVLLPLKSCFLFSSYAELGIPSITLPI